MKRLRLERRVVQDERTLGALFDADGDRICHTLEPGYLDVEHARVDPGFYHCVQHESKRYDTWALVGADCSHFTEPGCSRST